jgi:hypothetical protein
MASILFVLSEEAIYEFSLTLSARAALSLSKNMERLRETNSEIQCCQIFLGTTYQNGNKYTKHRKDRKIYFPYIHKKLMPAFLFQGLTKYTQIGIFGMQICIPSGNPARNPKKATQLQTLAATRFEEADLKSSLSRLRRLFLVSNPLCLSSSSALHFFRLFFLGPPPC